MAEFHAAESSIAREWQNSTRWSIPSLGNRKISRAGIVHCSGNVEFHARESSTAQESQNPTRWGVPSPRNSRISRAVEVHRSKIAYSHALSFIFTFNFSDLNKSNFSKRLFKSF